MSKSQANESSSTTPEEIAARVPRSPELKLAELKTGRLMHRHAALVLEMRALISAYQNEPDNSSTAKKIKALEKERIALEGDMTRARIESAPAREAYGAVIAAALAPTAARAAADFLAGIERSRAAAAVIGQCAHITEMNHGRLPTVTWVNFNLLEAEARHIIGVLT